MFAYPYVFAVSCLLWVLVLLPNRMAFAQISPDVNTNTATNSPADSTNRKITRDSVRYEASTASYLYEHELYYNRDQISEVYLKDSSLFMKGLHYADTSIQLIHRYNATQKRNNMWHDLGSLGTATQPVFYQMPQEIGTKLGYDVYNEYQVRPQDVKYYDTFSSFTDLYVVVGGKGRSKMRVNLTRNITPHWNIGITYQRMQAFKNFGRNSRRNDDHVAHETYLVNTRYFSPNQKYKLLAHFTATNHAVRENGGYETILPADTVQNLNELFDLNIAQWQQRVGRGVQSAENSMPATQQRTVARLYQQYALLDSTRTEYLQAFHIGEFTQQKNEFSDHNFRNNYIFTSNNRQRYTGLYLQRFAFDSLAFYNPPTINAPVGSQAANLRNIVSPFYRTDFRQFDNRLGLKGKAKKFDYRAYVRMRNYSITHEFMEATRVPFFVENVQRRDTVFNLAVAQSPQLRSEVFVGGSLHYQFTDSSLLDVEAEHLLARDYRLKALYANKFFRAGIEQAFYTPNLVQQRIFGSFVKWDNDFNNTLSTQIFGTLRLPLPFVSLRPTVRLTNLQNYVYFDQKATPQQSPDNLSLLQWEVEAIGKWRNMRANLQVVRTDNFQSSLLPVPNWLVNMQVYYENKMFKNALFGQIGIDLHYKSGYTAMGYLPALQQFYLQDRWTVENFIVADAFFNFKVSRAMLFLKVTNILQDVLGKGYFITPVYLGQPRSFELGINWLFFDATPK